MGMRIRVEFLWLQRRHLAGAWDQHVGTPLEGGGGGGGRPKTWILEVIIMA